MDFMDSCSLFLFLLTFFGGYDLYIISTEYYPLELERAAEARRAVVASEMLKIEFLTLTLSLTQLQKWHTHTLFFNCNVGENVDFSTYHRS